MRIHQGRDLVAGAWYQNGSPGRVQFRLGVARYSAIPEEARQFVSELLDAIEIAERDEPQDA